MIDMMDMREPHPPNNQKQKLRKTALRRRLAKARGLVRRHIPPTASLVDELVEERREETRRESDQDK
jgi:hypothetical protein